MSEPTSPLLSRLISVALLGFSSSSLFLSANGDLVLSRLGRNMFLVGWLLRWSYLFLAKFWKNLILSLTEIAAP